MPRTFFSLTSAGCSRYLAYFVSFSMPLVLWPWRASASTIQGLMLEPRFLLVKGPSGTYSHAWTSRALQSLSRT